ncbi:RteC domain-containing protein [Sphingobacterium thalpophilum]
MYVQGVFNNGNTDIKLIAKKFEDAFRMKLGDFYHTLMEL